jgi:hypothetical protein
VTFIADATDTVQADAIIYAEDSHNAAAPLDRDDYVAKDLTTASVDWSEIESWTSGNPYDTPDISAIIQEIVRKGAWSSGNAIQIMIKRDTPGTADRVFETYDDVPANSAKLFVTWVEGTTTTTTSSSTTTTTSSSTTTTTG